ncbi:MAG: DUF2235 domain-containing protein [Pseudomonadota bacterium]
MDPEDCEFCESREPPAPPPQKVRAAVFFDGTLNNRGNTRSSSPISGSDSYGASPSNVAKGEENMDPYPDVDNIGQHYYIEGIGTTTGAADSQRGYALGTGDTGIVAKVERGLRRLIQDISQLDRQRPIEYVHIDTFGFSRGAAAARHFVHVALNDRSQNVRKQLQDLGFTVNAVVVKFVGLYDTVASYGVRHTNDTSDLNLNAIRAAEYTYQLAAGDEHRVNFRLTDIQSAAAGKQIYLPGVHSDIGGGYNSTENETNHQVIDFDDRGLINRRRDLASLARERQWLIDRGWYTDAELSQENFFWEIHANRRGILNTYANLALNMMADEARGRGVPFRRSLATRHAIPRDSNVQAVRGLIDASIAAGNVEKGSAYQDYWLQMSSSRALNAVRHRYFHMSSRFEDSAGAHQPQYTGHPSNGGVRRRIVQRG